MIMMEFISNLFAQSESADSLCEYPRKKRKTNNGLHKKNVETEVESSLQWVILSPELQLLILSYLPPSTLCKLWFSKHSSHDHNSPHSSLVSRHFRCIARDPTLWKNIVRDYYGQETLTYIIRESEKRHRKINWYLILTLTTSLLNEMIAH
jgi:hypothetical protein